MSLSKKQIHDLKFLNELESHSRATVNYKTRAKLENDLDNLANIEFMLSHLPREHAKKAVKDKHVFKLMNILLSLLDLREFKRVRQNAPGEDGYVIKPFRGKYKRMPLTIRDNNRYRAMAYFFINFKNFFNPNVILPGDIPYNELGPILPDWISADNSIDYKIHLQQIGRYPMIADIPYVESEAELEELTQKAIHKNIDATNEMIEFFKSTH